MTRKTKKVETIGWSFSVNKNYSKEDFFNKENAKENFINDIANGNFKIETETI